MKTLAKHLHFIPDVHFHIHINPIHRDIVMITAMGLLVAAAALTLLVAFVSQF